MFKDLFYLRKEKRKKEGACSQECGKSFSDIVKKQVEQRVADQRMSCRLCQGRKEGTEKGRKKERKNWGFWKSFSDAVKKQTVAETGLSKNKLQQMVSSILAFCI